MVSEIFLCCAGVALIIVSILLNGNKEKESSDSSFSELVSDEQKDEINKLVKESADKASDEVIIKTDDQLDKISNEKIMALDEFGNQINAKIEENHDHVVFLYNMLNQKDDEIKATLSDMESAKNEMKDTVSDMLKIARQLNNAIKKTSKSEKTTEKKSEKPDTTAYDGPSEQMSMNDVNVFDNRNDEILKLYKEGRSILDISKKLDIGQGEVKLVIDLYGA